MNSIKKFSEDLEEKIINASFGKAMKPSILFCGCDHRVKKDMHKIAKRIGLNPSYSIKHPTIKVELNNNRKLETDKYKTTRMNYDHFEYICRYLER